MACADDCGFKISIEEPLNQYNATELMLKYWQDEFMDFDVEDKTEASEDYKRKFSDWVRLEKDEYYYTEATLYNSVQG